MTKLSDTVIEMMVEFEMTADLIKTETQDVFCLRYAIGDEVWVSLLTEREDGTVQQLNFQGESLEKLKSLINIIVQGKIQ